MTRTKAGRRGRSCDYLPVILSKNVYFYAVFVFRIFTSRTDIAKMDVSEIQEKVWALPLFAFV